MGPMRVETPADQAVLIMERELDAPRELVWSALTDPAQVVKWYGGHGFENPVCEMDVRPGGRWRHVMRTPDGQEFAMELEFLEVVPPERLVWQNVGHDAPGAVGPHNNHMTVTLEPLDGGARTRWHLVTRFKSLADRQAAGAIGFTAVLEQGTEKFADVLRELAR
jgi:uncharacterized protein YndB with AHSA1/START domain